MTITSLTVSPFSWRFSTALSSQTALRNFSRVCLTTTSISPSIRRPTAARLKIPTLFFRFLLTASSTIPKLLKDFSLTCFRGTMFSMRPQEPPRRIIRILLQLTQLTMTQSELTRVSLKSFRRTSILSSLQSFRQLSASFPRALSAHSRLKAKTSTKWLKTLL